MYPMRRSRPGKPVIASRHHFDAIVVGGGLAGLAVSRQLLKAGIDVVTLERRRASANEGFAINLPGNAIAALEEMGLGAQIAGIGRPTMRREYRDHRGRLLFGIDEDAFWGAGCRPRCVRRSELLALLGAGMPDAVLRMSSEVETIEAGPCAVSVTTRAADALMVPYRSFDRYRPDRLFLTVISLAYQFRRRTQ